MNEIIIVVLLFIILINLSIIDLIKILIKKLIGYHLRKIGKDFYSKSDFYNHLCNKYNNGNELIKDEREKV